MQIPSCLISILYKNVNKLDIALDRLFRKYKTIAVKIDKAGRISHQYQPKDSDLLLMHFSHYFLVICFYFEEKNPISFFTFSFFSFNYTAFIRYKFNYDF